MSDSSLKKEYRKANSEWILAALIMQVEYNRYQAIEKQEEFTKKPNYECVKEIV